MLSFGDMALSIWASVQQHWDQALSLVGIGLTVYYARGAMTASRAAEAAALSARARLLRIDYFSEVNRLVSICDELYRLLEQKEWQSVNDRANMLRFGCGDLVNVSDLNIDLELIENIQKLGAVFKSIALAADRARDPRKSNPDIFRYRSIVSDARNSLTALSNAMKNDIGREQ